MKSKLMIRAWLCMLAVLPFSAWTQDRSEAQCAVNVSEILKSPERFDGKTVIVKGWLTIRHEDTGLWATENDYKKRNTKSCISLMNRYKDESMNKSLDGRHVTVTGTFFKDISHDENGRYVFRPDACSDFGIRFAEPLGLRQIERSDPR